MVALSYAECKAILEQFRPAHQNFLRRNEVHGVQVMILDGSPTLVVLVTKKIEDSELRQDERLPERFTYHFEAREASLPIAVKVSAVARSHNLCQPGDPASGDPQSYYGSLGWNFYLKVFSCVSVIAMCSVLRETIRQLERTLR